jgi:Family of unknown function (DUF7002)
VVTEAELDELLQDCPTLYHMAEKNSWPSIQNYGLLSTTRLLDLFDVGQPRRTEIESRRRPVSVYLEHVDLGRAVIRDQFPMDDKGLERCLEDRLSPRAWYKLLNAKVFFWLTRERLLRLLNAGTYRNEEHDVIELDTRLLVAAYRENIWLCPMNSGCTKPYPHPRGIGTFRRIRDYPYAEWSKKRIRGERVVELAVDDGIHDVAPFVKRVLRMRGNDVLI